MSNVYHQLASGSLSQTWTDISLITKNDEWTLVPSIQGFLGDIDSATGADPQTVTGETIGALDVIANQTTPNSLASGGVAEFEIADPTIALNGSGTADAPSLVIYLDATGREDVRLQFNARDLDGSVDNSQQQIAVQYRIGETGAWTNVPAGYISDATQGPSIAGQVTPIDVTLPSEVNNQAQVQVRILTTNAAGNDEWVGIDDINVSSEPLAGDTLVSIGDATITEGDSGTQFLTFTVTRSDNTGDVHGRLPDRGRQRQGRQRLCRRDSARSASPPAARSRRRSPSPSTATPTSSRTRISRSPSATWSTRPARRPSATASRPAPSRTTISRWS